MSPARRRIAVVSTSRADYGHLYHVMKGLQAAEDVELLPVALGAHGSPRFGETWRRFAEDGFPLAARLECLLDSDSDLGMAKTIGLATLSLADWLDRERPDLLLLIADRYEMLAPASVALALRIPIAHIEGGEISEGAVDDAVRHALTKLSHLHFVPTEQARRRVLAMGEEAWRVHRVGAPSLDHLHLGALPDPVPLLARWGLGDDLAPVVVAWHPVTLLRDPAAESASLFEALQDCAHPLAFCFPNADAGREAIIRQAEAFCAGRERARVFVNLEHREYWALLHAAAALVGNSSSGIMESPSLSLPCVNIGERQAGRERAANILDAPAEPAAIREALSRALDPAFRASLDGMQSPYGDGHAAERIVEVLRRVPLDARLLRKRALPLRRGEEAFDHAG
ncbi:UDP-N-acetylglucosamine 2-epimerase [Pseudomarimonas salicorniae]|uniref:UDP-N-acetylglucosamine 2-epimerase n=1 Tax=Pseudomarimonas salicorniae TaxID=2933270 RepID=A0ABT0GG54_9GAMM|nr:UDP-N-acetylglucosamine 2-epimerase [Lysobacter sp. CAU 1642]MCK7592995.1 UDP-N-acetylglucosamine 2-epimerase [Lysobacter sp. CAU 1642]